MLHYLLKWKTYRTLKNGLLLDYITKKVFYKISSYFFYTFTIFFGDKYLLEHLFSNLQIFVGFFLNKLKFLNKNSFIKFFKVTIFLITYGLSIGLIFYVL